MGSHPHFHRSGGKSNSKVTVMVMCHGLSSSTLNVMIHIVTVPNNPAFMGMVSIICIQTIRDKLLDLLIILPPAHDKQRGKDCGAIYGGPLCLQFVQVICCLLRKSNLFAQ